MKKNVIYLLIFLACSLSFGAKYAVDREDGGISIISYNESSQDSLEQVVKELGFSGRPIFRINESELPPRNDREYWKRSGASIVVDTAKKQADADKESLKQSEVSKVLEKLKISKEELRTIKAEIK